MLNVTVFDFLRKSIASLVDISPEMNETIRKSIETPPSLEYGEKKSEIEFLEVRLILKNILEDGKDNENSLRIISKNW